MVVARKHTYLPHPVEKTWCHDVRAIIESKPRGYQEQMRKFIEERGIKCSSGELSEVLNGHAHTSVFVGPIHEFLGWPPPIAPIVARDAGEVMHLLERVTPEQRALIGKAAAAVAGLSGADAAAAIAAVLRMTESKPKND